MSLGLEGRTIVITGAGRGIGRASALALARRGANVVVNDRGGSMHGTGSDAGPAAAVVDEIVQQGGSAVADASDASTAAGTCALVARAIDAFGSVHGVIANAGIVGAGEMFPETPDDLFERMLAIHVKGPWSLVQAAWPYFVEQSYGRILLTTSAGIFGIPGASAYGTAKASVLGLNRALAIEGQEHGILVNAIAPAAMTRMAGAVSEEDSVGVATDMMPPDAVAPAAVALMSSSWKGTGEVYGVGGGRVDRYFIGRTQGLSLPLEWRAEEMLEQQTMVHSEAGYTVPRSAFDTFVR